MKSVGSVDEVLADAQRQMRLERLFLASSRDYDGAADDDGDG